MKTQTLKSGKYEIDYRTPNLIETMELIGDMGLNDAGEMSGNSYKAMATMIKQAAPFIVEVRHDKEIVSWEDALHDREGFGEPAALAASAIISGTQETEKKKSRKKP